MLLYIGVYFKKWDECLKQVWPSILTDMDLLEWSRLYMLLCIHHKVTQRIMEKTGTKNLQIMNKIVLALLGIVKESHKVSMPKMRYQHSLSYEVE